MMHDLKCTVDSCHYWGTGNHCSAEGIEVNNMENSTATTSDETVCKTFKPEG
ncbi:MAG TPA: DUF1540 domain-containing protein [Desulfobacteria bacterium]|nr:DUF1540 domain-containing protein [Desulfobacteria bacterium]